MTSIILLWSTLFSSIIIFSIVPHILISKSISARSLYKVSSKSVDACSRTIQKKVEKINSYVDYLAHLVSCPVITSNRAVNGQPSLLRGRLVKLKEALFIILALLRPKILIGSSRFLSRIPFFELRRFSSIHFY